MTDTIYTEVSGTTAYVNGERGTVVHMAHTPGRQGPSAAFVSLAERPAMFHLTLGTRVGERLAHSEIIRSTEVDRDEFDRLVGLEDFRREMGWTW